MKKAVFTSITQGCKLAKDRAAKREERRLLKQQKAQRLADKYSEKHNTSKELKQSQEIEPPKIPITPENRKETLKKLPVFKEKPSIYDTKMTWCTSITDIEDAWSWGEHRN